MSENSEAATIKRTRLKHTPRAKRGFAAVSGYMAALYDGKPKVRFDDTDIIDVLAAILHYAHTRGWDAQACARMATDHFIVETGSPRALPRGDGDSSVGP